MFHFNLSLIFDVPDIREWPYFVYVSFCFVLILFCFVLEWFCHDCSFGGEPLNFCRVIKNPTFPLVLTLSFLNTKTILIPPLSQVLSKEIYHVVSLTFSFGVFLE